MDSRIAILDNIKKCCVKTSKVVVSGFREEIIVSNSKQEDLGDVIKCQREKLGLSTRDIEAMVGIDKSTVVRIEKGAFKAPRPDVLVKLAKALKLSVSELYSLVGYTVPKDLPSLNTYLRTKNHDLPEKAQKELEAYVKKLRKAHGLKPEGPRGKEDEN